MKKAGNPSEIGAISFGITVDRTQSAAAFAATRADASTTANTLAKEGARGGAAYDSALGGAIAAGKGLKAAKKALGSILNLAIIGPAVATSSFLLGQKIGEEIVKGLQSNTETRFEAQIKSLQEAFEKARAARFEDVEKALKEGRRGVHPGIIEQRAEQASEATTKIKELTDAIAAMRENIEELERGRVMDDTGMASTTAADIRTRYAQIVQLHEKINVLTVQRAKDQEFVNAKLREARDLTRQELEAAVKKVLMERAEKAQDPGRIDSLSVNIARIRALMEISARQRLPVDPGNGFVPMYGGGGP